MRSQPKINNPWGYSSRIIIFVFIALQLLRLPSLPEFMDIYYHLQSASGFIQAGGYTNWDFWEYAPFGRPNLYPPLFHIILALLMKTGIGVVWLAKLFEFAAPVAFLVIVRGFIIKNYGEELGFFVTAAFCSSFAFFIFLSNHIPASLALVLGFLSLGELFRNRVLRPVILLGLCFYTHASVPWFFALSYAIYGIMDKGLRRDCLRVVFYSLLVAFPILLFEFINLPFIQLSGNIIPGRFHLQLKPFDYILAGFGLFLAFRMSSRYRIFIAMLLSALIFLPYPYRLLSAEGYLPVVFLSGIGMRGIWRRLKASGIKAKRFLAGALISFILFVSPALVLEKPGSSAGINYKFEWIDSAPSALLLGKGSSLWFPGMYFPIVDIIKKNSSKEDIVYSGINFSGIILAALSGRASSNAIFPEVGPSIQIDPLSVAGIVILPKDLDEGFIEGIARKYKLFRLGENEYFRVFRSTSTSYKVKVPRASFSFGAIMFVFLLLAGLFWWRELAGIFRKKTYKTI